MITAELDTSTIEIANSIDNIALDNTNTIAGYDNSYNVDIEDLSDLDITVAKKEYTIVGDDIYIPQLYDDAPQWMKDLVGLVVDVSMATNSTKLINDMNAMLQEFAVSYVPLNQYTQSILDLGNEDMRLNALIETLNSNFSNGLSNANAQIINLQMTKASKDEVVAQVIQTLAAQLANPDSNLGATVVRLDQAIVDEQTARATSFQALTASMESIDRSITANAEVLETALAYVGIDQAGGSTGTGLLADVSILQKQNDGVIETTTGTYDVMLGVENPNNNTGNDELDVTKEPYKSWRDADAIAGGVENRAKHVGDVYIKYSAAEHGYKTYERAYKFIRTSVDNTSPYSTDAEGFTWALIVDTDAQNAYVAALNALDLADNKRRVFVSTPSVPYDIGDLWLVQAGAAIIGTTQGGRVIQAGDLLRCSEAKTATGLYENNDWIPADNYRESMDAIQTDLNNWRTGTYATFVTNIQTQVDGKAETFYQNSVPTGRVKALNVPNNAVLNKYVGDLWKNTYVGTVSGYLGNNTEYVYTKKANGANWDYDWTKMEVPDIVFDTIDTKKSIYSGDSVPVAVAPDVIEVNDMWITGSNVVGYDKESIYVWNGSAWIKPLKYTDDSATVALQTGLANGTVTVKLTNAYVGTTPFLTYLTNEIDKEVVVYSGTNHLDYSSLGSLKPNDLYIEKTTAAGASGVVVDVLNTWKCLTVNPTAGVVTSATWLQIGNNNNITALADLADGKRTVFSGNTVPVGAVARDIWIPSATNGSYLQGEIYQYNGTAWIVATKYSADLEAVRSNLQSQVDGKVETYYQATVPTGMTSVNNGDYWYCTADVSTYKKGKVYKYVHTTTSWVETADVSRYAFDTADGKAAIFTSTNAPTTGYKVNDMLIVIGSFNNGTTTFSDGVVLSSNSNRVSGFTASDWVKKINDTEDLDEFVSVTYTPTVTSLQNQVDGKIESWYTASTSDPKSAWTDAPTRAKHDGDMWYQTDTKRSYWYSSSTNAWNLIDDEKAIQALTNAATAQATADGVVVSFYAIKQDTTPATTSLWLNKTGTKVLKKYTTSWVNVAVKVGDTLTAYDPVTKDTSVYVYDGTGWITNTENGIVAGSEAITTLTTNLATTNTTVGGHTTQLNTVDTRIANGVASVETKWAYNSIVNINGTSYGSGFGIATSLTSGSGLLTGQSEFWIKADTFKLMSADGSKKSSYSPFTVDSATGEINFNGKVTFSNVTNVPQLGSTPQEVVNAVNNGQTTTINGGKITTESITATQIAANTITANKINVTTLSSISANLGTITSGVIYDSTWDGSSYKMKIDLTNGRIYIK